MAKINVRIPAPLQKLARGEEQISASGEKVRDVLENMEANYPGIKSKLVADDGSMRRFVNIYLNEEDIRFLEKLDTRVKEGDTISIIPAIAGGGAFGK